MIEKIREFIETHRARLKHIGGILCVACIVLWVIYRFVAIGAESRMDVFNNARDAAVHGVPVDVLEMHAGDGVLREPLFVKSNRAFVSGARVARFRVGQRVGAGRITSVANSIDYDTGMYVIKTSGVTDGEYFAERNVHGLFVPVYAIEDGAVMVASNGVAERRTVTISAQDADNALVTDGIHDGDIVILSHVDDGVKVKF